MGRFTFDLSRWPLVIATAPAHIDAAIAREGVQRLRSLFSMHAKITVLLDVRARTSRPDAALRKVWAELLRSMEPELARHVAAWAVVTSSPLLRAAYTAILWLAPPPCPTAFFTSMDDGEAWLRNATKRGRAITSASVERRPC